MTLKRCFAIIFILLFLPGLLNHGALPIQDVSAASQEALQPAAGGEQTLSTPELIEKAYRAGELTREQRLVSLASAVFDFAALPDRFKSDQPWEGTWVVRELNAVRDELKTGQADDYSPAFKTEFERRLDSPNGTVCDRSDPSHSYDSAHFHLNYGDFAGGLNYLDYADALEATFAVEVTSYGWAKPPAYPGNPWGGRYPVQVVALSTGLYGYTTTGGGAYTGFIGDNPNTSAVETAAYASCIVLNNQFSFSSVAESSEVFSTSAHEFVHAIQFGIGDPGAEEDLMWYESIAAYMEDEVLDASNSNYSFLWPDFNTCLGQYGGNVYSNWLFFRYVAERLGGTNVAGGGEDVAQNAWTSIADGTRAMPAYTAAVAGKGGSLTNLFHNYAISARFMRACSGPGDIYCFEEAAGYLAKKGSISSHASLIVLPGFSGVYWGSIRDGYGVNWVDFPTSGTMNVSLSNLSAGSQLRGSLVAQTAAGLSVTPFPAVIANGSSTSLLSYKPPSGTTRLVAVLTNSTLPAPEPTACNAGTYRLDLDVSLGDTKFNYLPLVTKEVPMQGRVTYRGAPVAGTTVQLRYRDNSGGSFITYATATTDDNGKYLFHNHPILTGESEAKYVRWVNESKNEDYLWGWYCDYNYADSSEDKLTCNFDLQDVQLVSPPDRSIKSLPVSFSWQRRLTTNDSYELNLYGNNYVPYYYSSRLGYVSSFTLTFLPPDFSYDDYYGWEIWAYGPDGYGISYDLYAIEFYNHSMPNAPAQLFPFKRPPGSATDPPLRRDLGSP